MAPQTNWFEYYSITRDSERPSNELWFISDSEYKRPIPIVNWIDRLRCRNPGGGAVSLFSTYTDKGSFLTKKERDLQVWQYQGRLPSTLHECVLHSTVVAEVGYGVTKTFDNITDWFYIKS